MTSDDTKGTRDYPPRLATAKQRIRDTIRDHAERYAYQPLETPTIESRSILTSKFTGGEEILKEMYTLTDQGERELGLRYDLTVPFARFIAEHPEIKHPFKRYQCGNVYRDGPIKQGRYREFQQFDLDVVGGGDVVWDAELISIVHDVLTDLGINPDIQVNTRGLLTAVIDHVNPSVDTDSIILTVDKYEKKGRSGVKDELVDKGVTDKEAEDLLSILDVDGSNEDIIDHFDDYGDIDDLKALHDYLDAENVAYTVNPYLARGLTYYTGTIFEAFPTNASFDRSIAAGGRYDDMISELSEHEDSLPAVGASFGVDTLLDCIEDDMTPRGDDLLVIPMTDTATVLEDVQRIRDQGVPTMLASPEKSFRKNMDYADKEGFGYLLVIGDDEQSTGEYTVKDLDTGDEHTSGIDGVGDSIDALKEI